MRHKRSHVLYRALSFLLLIILFAAVSPLAAGGWYRLSQDNTIAGFVDAAISSPDGSINALYALGQYNMFYSSDDGGLFWDMYSIPAEGELVSIASAYDYEYETQVAVAVGTNGAVWHYRASTDLWEQGEFPDTVNLNVVYYNPIEGNYWIGGEASSIYFSFDQGVTWERDTVDVQNLNIKLFQVGGSNLFSIGSRNDSTFVLNKQYYFIGKSTQLTIGDTIPDFIPIASYLMNGQEGYEQHLLLLGQKSSTGETQIFSKNLRTGMDSFTMIFSGDLGNVTDLNGFGPLPNTILWISTKEGAVWESRDSARTWQKIYKDPEDTPLSTIIASEVDSDNGRILGESGVVLKYGFEFLAAHPPVNGYLDIEQNAIELKFSQIPDISTFSQQVTISSRYVGEIPFVSEYDLTDSTRIILKMDDMYASPLIPGDQWNINLSAGLREATRPYNYLWPIRNLNFNVLPDRNSDFIWKRYKSGTVGRSGITNFVTGFFNNDDAFDLITFSNDSLVCFSGDTMATEPVTRLFFPELISVNSRLREQIAVANLDHDNRPDLILYDESNIRLLVNTSEGDGFSFNDVGFGYTGINIRQVVPYNKNSNTDIDLLVLANEVYTIMDVNVDSASAFTISHELQTDNFRQVQVGDINADGFQDLVMINNTGALIIRAGDTSDTFNRNKEAYTLKPDYQQVRLADLDGNGSLEILASNGSQIDAYTLNNFNTWRFDSTDIQVIASSASGIIDFTVQDFGGSRSADARGVFDVALVTQDSLEVFQNETVSEKKYLFTPRKDNFVDVQLTPQSIIYGDFNKDGLLDLCLSDRESGQFSVWRKYSWKPKVQAQMLRRHEITLTWDPFPDSLGTIDFYRVMRDTVSYVMNPDAYIRETYSNQFVDREVEDYRSYWYSVQAVYNDGIEGDWSEPVLMETFILLDGEQVAVLNDSTRPYLAQTSISVPTGEQLDILPGVEISFMPGTALDVYGGLRVMGGGDEAMVDMHSFGDSPEDMWKGIYIHPAADTVYMQWFSIFGAETGVNAVDRPLMMRFAGLMRNQVGLDFSGDSLSFANMVFDSNLTAITLRAGTHAEIRNITVLNSGGPGLLAEADARVKVRNAIFWNNGAPVTRQSADAQVAFSYSTVDSLQPGIIQHEISHLPPLFMASDSGEFRPDVMSPTIDAGDPNDDFSREPQPNGGRINQGVFGGLEFATPSFQPRLRVIAPPVVRLEARPGETDSLQLGLFNFGYADLTVYQALVQDTVHYKINLEQELTVAPGDTVPVTLLFLPQQRILYEDQIQFVCNDPHLEKGLLELSVQGQGLNSPPVIEGTTPPIVAKVGSLYLYRIQAQDADGDALQYRADSLPQWLTLTNSGVIRGVPALKDTGEYHIRVEVDDGHGGVVPVAFSLQVVPGDLKYIPDVVLTPLSDSVIKESAVRFHFTIQDSNVITGLTPPNDNRIRYFLIHAVTKDTVAKADTAGIDQLEFYPLPDGFYVFKIWAYNQEKMGILGKKAQTVQFAIRADKRSPIRFRWYMIAIPRQETIDWQALQVGDSAAVLLRWDNQEEEYSPVTRSQLLPGQAFWMLPLKQMTVDVSKIEQNFKGQTEVRVAKGWNQVGIPVNYSVRFRDIRFIPGTQTTDMGFLEAVEAGYLKPAVYWFMQSAESQGYDWTVVDTATVVWPWRGYWINADTDGKLIFTNQPAFGSDSSLQIVPVAKRSAPEPQQQGWQMSLKLSNKQYSDYKNVFGIFPTKAPIVAEPPHFGDFCSLTFQTDHGNATQFIQDDFKDLTDVKTWELQVATKITDQEHILSWDNRIADEQDLYVYLVDLESEQIIPMHRESEYRFKPKGTTTRFKIYATRDESFKPQIVPLVYKLQQNYPNPFNPTTTIRFGLPEEADGKQVSLKIFDVLGREVRTLYSGKLSKGYHKFEWDGTNQAQRQVASGVYFYQLLAGKKKLVRKMVLLR